MSKIHNSPPTASEALRCTTAPWEWILERILDIPDCSLPFLQGVIAFVSYIKEPHCSRLLQKVALRYLEEAVIHRRLGVCEIYFLKFILNEQGVSNLCRIHSLKEAFENDLVVRVEMEVLLSYLRCDANGEKDWDAYKIAVDRIFPENLSGLHGAERRKELIAVLPDRCSDELQKAMCEQLLAKYPFGELLRDIAHFVKDKRKLFKSRFLDQLAKDVDTGDYLPSAPLSSDSPRIRSLHDDCASDAQVPATMLAGQESDVYSTSGISSKVKPAQVIFEGAEEHADAVRRSVGGSILPESTSGHCRYNETTVTMGGEIGNRLGLEETTKEVDLRESISHIRVQSNDGGALVNKLNQLMNNGPTVREDVDDATLTTDPFLKQQASELFFPTYRPEVSIHCNATEDDVETKMHAEPGARMDTTMKRAANDIALPFDGTAKRARSVDSETQSELHKEQDKQSKMSIPAKDRGSEFDAFSTEDAEQLRGRKDAPNRAGNEDLEVQRGRRQRTRVYLTRVSKEGHQNCKNLKISEELGQAVGQSRNREREGKCWFCESTGGSQVYCHNCPISIHESCLLKHSGSETTLAVDECWYCLICAATLAQENVKNAEENIKKAKEVMRKAEREAFQNRKRLAAFVTAKADWLREHYQPTAGLVDLLKGTRRDKTKRPLQNSPSASKSNEWSKSEPPTEKDENMSNSLQRGKDTNKTATSHISTLDHELQAVRGSDVNSDIPNVIADWQGCTLALSSPAECGAKLQEGGRQRIGVDRQGSGSAPSSPTKRGAKLQDDESRRSAGQEVHLRGLERVLLKPRASDANDNHISSRVPQGGHCGAGGSTDAAKGSESSVLPVDTSKPPSDPVCNIVHHGGEEGNGHDGDLHEVCESNRAVPNGKEVAERGDATEHSNRTSVAPNAESKQRRQKAYRGRYQIPGFRRRNLPWTETEEAALKEIVKMFSHDGQWGFQWNRILEYGNGKFDKSRTAVDLKDKWRNMRKAGAT